jgi:hypothetical protein
MKVLNTRWFTNSVGCIGIVKVETDYDGIKYYIGGVAGNDEATDAQYVADWGSTFPENAGDVLFGVKE